MLLVFGSAWVKQTPLCKKMWTREVVHFSGKSPTWWSNTEVLPKFHFFRRAESLNRHDTSGRFLSLAVASLIVVRITFHVVLQAFSASKLILMQVVAWDLLVKNLASITNESHLVFQALGFFYGRCPKPLPLGAFDGCVLKLRFPPLKLDFGFWLYIFEPHWCFLSRVPGFQRDLLPNQITKITVRFDSLFV